MCSEASVLYYWFNPVYLNLILCYDSKVIFTWMVLFILMVLFTLMVLFALMVLFTLMVLLLPARLCFYTCL